MIRLRWWEFALHILACSTLTILLTCPRADAGSCGTVTYSGGYGNYGYAPTYHAPVYENHHVEKIIILDYLPPYPVGYAAPYAPPPPPAAVAAPAPSVCETKHAALEARFAALEAKLNGAAPSVKEALPAPATPPVGGGKSLLVGKCAACHDASIAATKGKGVALSDGGSLLPWSAELTGKVMREVSSGRMPKGAKLPPEDFAQIAQELFDASSK